MWYCFVVTLLWLWQQQQQWQFVLISTVISKLQGSQFNSLSITKEYEADTQCNKLWFNTFLSDPSLLKSNFIFNFLLLWPPNLLLSACFCFKISNFWLNLPNCYKLVQGFRVTWLFTSQVMTQLLLIPQSLALLFGSGANHILLFIGQYWCHHIETRPIQ